jgi:hypoxanthine phosphoribosyltransferase
MPSPRFKEFSFNGDPTKYIAPSWDQMGILNFELIQQVRESGKEYDRVVAMAKGGWTWARAFVDGMGMDALSSLRVKLYIGINEKADKPEIIEPLTADVRGRKVLLFDDVVDSGETYAFAQKHLIEDHGAAEVDTAALFWKPKTAVIEPTFSAAETDAWIVFPHEVNEFVRETAKSWKAKGLSDGEIMGRYFKLGLPYEQAEYYLSKVR